MEHSPTKKILALTLHGFCLLVTVEYVNDSQSPFEPESFGLYIQLAFIHKAVSSVLVAMTNWFVNNYQYRNSKVRFSYVRNDSHVGETS